LQKSILNFRYFLLLPLICVIPLICPAQEKSIKSEEYLNKRPEAMGGTLRNDTSREPKRNKATMNRSPVSRGQTGRDHLVYVVDKDFPLGIPPKGIEYVRLGVTIWRLTPTQCPIPGCSVPATNQRGLMDTAAPIRVDDNSAFSTGERVRLGLELLSSGGFIYIIDREQFADGTFGEPYLLFPTKSINEGNNWARPGMQIQLPRAEGCFCVKSRNAEKTLVADSLIVIVSPTPLLQTDEIGIKEIPLPSKLISFLKRPANEIVYRGSLKGGSGLAQTSPEHAAGAKGLFDTEPTLTQNDLPPQNLYQSSIGAGSAAVFSFSLKYGSKILPQ
jgi:hypothetical protein